MVKVFFFGGHEGIQPEDAVEMREWSKEAAEELITAAMGPDWADEIETDSNGPMRDTIFIVSDNLITAVEDSVEGGMLYIVRV